MYFSFCIVFRNRKLSASRRDTMGPRYDKKYLVLGEKMEEGRYETNVVTFDPSCVTGAKNGKGTGKSHAREKYVGRARNAHRFARAPDSHLPFPFLAQASQASMRYRCRCSPDSPMHVDQCWLRLRLINAYRLIGSIRSNLTKKMSHRTKNGSDL